MQPVMFGGTEMLSITQRKPSPQSEVETLCFGAVFLLRAQGNFTTLKGPMDKDVYCKILEESLHQSARTLKMARG